MSIDMFHVRNSQDFNQMCCWTAKVHGFLTSTPDGEWCPHWKSAPFPTGRRLDGTHSRSGCGCEEKHFAPAGNRVPVPPTPISLVTELYSVSAVSRTYSKTLLRNSVFYRRSSELLQCRPDISQCTGTTQGLPNMFPVHGSCRQQL